MSNDTVALDFPKTEAKAGAAAETLWQRVTFAGLTSGAQPSAAFHSVETLRDGTSKHFSQAVNVADEAVLLRLMRLPIGAKIRVCIRTDWAAVDISATLVDFCAI